MAIGDLRTPVIILKIEHGKDKEGFATVKEIPVACVRSYKEDKNTTEKWSNRAMFQQASSLFKIRHIPRLTITTDMKIDCYDGRYEILSVENVKGKNMYIEILARKEVSSDGKNDGEIT